MDNWKLRVIIWKYWKLIFYWKNCNMSCHLNAILRRLHFVCLLKSSFDNMFYKIIIGWDNQWWNLLMMCTLRKENNCGKETTKKATTSKLRFLMKASYIKRWKDLKKICKKKHWSQFMRSLMMNTPNNPMVILKNIF